MKNLGKFTKNGKEVLLEENENGCLVCISHAKDDFGYTRIKYNGKQERLFRVVYMLSNGPIPEGMLVRHKCDNPTCCNIEHLELGTKKDNVSDMVSRGRDVYHNPRPQIRGVSNGQSKLTEEQVLSIFNSELGYRKLSKEYNVSKATIMQIKKGIIWSWLTSK